MALIPGDRIGAYEVLSLLGAGGMGEVYRARDVSLDREVALKVLPDVFAADPDRTVRFEREARVLASLNHPNIAAIHGFARAADTTFLVLELVPGDTLAERIARAGTGGPAIPYDEALPMARQIVDALDAAHASLVVHRDLKPANIKITADGRVKVLDFGLAKALDREGDGSAHPSTTSPTITSPAATRAGMILGTAAYMAPEQARGKAVDKRADIWAFGCVLYEMLAGRRAFGGDEVSDTLAFVITKEPDWAALPADTPPPIRRLLRRCLEKDRGRRLADISDARFEIDEALGGPSESEAVPATAQASSARVPFLPYTIAAVASVAVLVMLVVWAPWREAPAALSPRLRMDLGADVSLVTDPAPAIALSPDGSLLAFVAQGNQDTVPRLYLRRLEQLEARQVEGTEGAFGPFFSPDSAWIAFFAGGRLKKVSVAGGAVVTLADAPGARGGAWAEDGAIVFEPDQLPGTSLQRVSDAGGRPAPFAPLAEGEVTQRWPQLLPGGTALLYTSHRNTVEFDEASVVIRPLVGGVPGAPQVLQERAYHGRYVSSGHLMYVSEGTLFAAPFDPRQLRMTAAPLPVLDSLSALPRSGAAQIAVSQTGTLLYVPSRAQARVTISWMDLAGQTTPLRAAPGRFFDLAFSPDGGSLAMTSVTETGTRELMVYDLGRDSLRRLASDVTETRSPAWTPDGRRLTFVGGRGNPGDERGLFWQRSDGSGQGQRLLASPNLIAGSWHPGGRLLLFGIRTRLGRSLHALPVEGDEQSGWKPGTPAAIGRSEIMLMGPPAVSPDGRWVAYSSGEALGTDIWVEPFDMAGGRWQVAERAIEPRWSRANRSLFYRGSSDGQLMVVDYDVDGGSFRPLKARRVGAINAGPNSSYAVHPDGKRLAVTLPAGGEASANDRVVFVSNFFDELRRLFAER